MRILPILLVSLLLSGCGSSVGNLNEPTGSSGQSGGTPLVVTAQNALPISAAVAELTVPSGRHSLEVAGGDLRRIEIDGVAAALVELPLAFPVLDEAPSGNFVGPGGGSASLTVSGPEVTIAFVNFVTEDGTRLNGRALMTGRVDGYNGNVLVTFDAFEIADADGDYRIDGPVTLVITRDDFAGGHEERVERTMEVTVTDLSNGGTVEFIGGTSESDIITENGIQTGISTSGGDLLFRNYKGLNGLLRRVPTEPFRFTVNEATLVSTVLSGEADLVGDGIIRRRIISPNVFEVAVRPSGATEFQVLGVTDITDVDEDEDEGED